MFGTFGGRLETATETHFFQWFHLQPVASEPVEDGVKRYRPSGPSFKSEVAFDVTLDGEGNTVRLALHLARGFIEDVRNGPFATDIACSFLSDVLPEMDRAATEPLLVALQREMVNRSTVISRAGTIPEARPLGEWSGALDVYYGRADVFERALGHTRLALRNGASGSGPELQIIVNAR